VRLRFERLIVWLAHRGWYDEEVQVAKEERTEDARVHAIASRVLGEEARAEVKVTMTKIESVRKSAAKAGRRMAPR